jgi:hypothetical protein
MRGGDQLKSKIFSIKEYNDIVVSFKDQMESFSHY